MLLRLIITGITISAVIMATGKIQTPESRSFTGVDIAVPTGTFVYAAHDGTVTEATYDSYYGNYVVITDSKGYTTKYAHMDSLNVSAGQSVKKSDNIGKSGNTGSSTGSHLHIECLYNGGIL